MRECTEAGIVNQSAHPRPNETDVLLRRAKQVAWTGSRPGVRINVIEIAPVKLSVTTRHGQGRADQRQVGKVDVFLRGRSSGQSEQAQKQACDRQNALHCVLHSFLYSECGGALLREFLVDPIAATGLSQPGLLPSARKLQLTA